MSRLIRRAQLRGDPGLLSFGLKLGGKLLKGAVALGKKAFTKPGVVAATGTAVATRTGTSIAKRAAAEVGIAAVGGAAGVGLASLFGGRGGGGGGRRMNPLNMRALKRAIRRQDRFVDAARSGLKGTKFTVATRGAGKHHHGHGCKCSTCK